MRWVKNELNGPKPCVPCLLRLQDEFAPRVVMATWSDKQSHWIRDDRWPIDDQFVSHFSAITEPSDG